MSNALTQYLDLYADNRELIDGHASAPLNARRAEALDVLRGYERDGLPRLGAYDSCAHGNHYSG